MGGGADDFVDHTTQPNMTPDKAAFPDFHAKIRRESDYWDAAKFMKQVGLLS